MKFKVGDKVRIVKNVWDYSIHPHEDIGIGEVHTIVECRPGYKYAYYLDAYPIYSWCDEELELVEDKKFTKSDLQNGDVVIKRNGKVEIVLLPFGTMIVKGYGHNTLDDIRDDLTSVVDRGFDIIAVRRPIHPGDCCFNAFVDNLGELVYKREVNGKIAIKAKVKKK